MPCLIGLIALLAPRLVIVLMWIFGNGYFGRAYQSRLWPLLGFLFMPLTTLAYAFAINSNGSVNGGYLALVIIAVLVDLGLLGGNEAGRRKRRRRP
jgi:hypothetical protein